MWLIFINVKLFQLPNKDMTEHFLKIRFFNITYYHKDIFTHFTEIENKNTKLRMKGKNKISTPRAKAYFL